MIFSEGQVLEHQKSASFVSTHTNQSEDNVQLMQSSGSIMEQVEGEEEGEGQTQGRWLQQLHMLNVLSFGIELWARDYKPFFTLNPVEHENYYAKKISEYQ